MASSKFQPAILTVLLTLSTTFHLSISCFTAIYSFGDSLADTGNFVYSQGSNPTATGHLPNGETYFHKATGRSGDGRLIIDFIAQVLGVPLLPPSLAGSSNGQDFRRGANFAIFGAAALGNDFFKQHNLGVTWSNDPLATQVEWFKQMLPSLCSSDSGCKTLLSTALFMVGEIGGNDYNFLSFSGKTMDQIQAIVPYVVGSISSSISTLIGLGARTLVVPGNFPFGCMAVYLTVYRSSNPQDYDPLTGCIKRFNDFTEVHNRALQTELGRLQQLYPQTTIVYADYYHAYLNIIESPGKLGFNNAPLVACCGAGGPYNYNFSVQCGSTGAAVCNDPSSYISWDGVHLTETANKWVAYYLLQGPYASPPIASLSKCP